MTLFEELKWRGLVNDITSPDVEEAINKGGLKFYIGVDPTGDSLHIGHYCTVIATSKRLMEGGHTPIIIAGGGTGLIGDPKPNVERPMISKEAVAHNIKCIQNQISTILGGKIEIVNNADWLCEMKAIDYLRDFGKFFNVNYMLAKDTVKRRLDIGITYTEFSYMLLQSIDFLKLYEEHGVTMQVGGQDQWGNITAGIDLIRKSTGDEVYGFTMPLVTDSQGKKFGKSEGNALWLDKTKTSSYKLYQFFVNVEDSMVINYLKIYTFLSREEIEEYERKNNEHPELREAHKALAREIITFLHGKEEYERAEKLAQSLFNNKFEDLTKQDIADLFDEQDMKEVNVDISIVDIVISVGAASSKREAREFITSGAVSLNGNKITDINQIISADMFIDNTYVIIKRGKKNYYVGKKI